jgi:hypothetical protein
VPKLYARRPLKEGTAAPVRELQQPDHLKLFAQIIVMELRVAPPERTPTPRAT